MPVLVAIRSSRLMPGLRAMPAVTITTSLPAVGSYVVAPMILQSTPATGVASNRSRALPCGMPSTCGMSTRTISPSSLLAAQWAQVAPTFPAPMMLILARRMIGSSLQYCAGFAKGSDYGESDPRINRSANLSNERFIPIRKSIRDSLRMMFDQIHVLNLFGCEPAVLGGLVAETEVTTDHLADKRERDKLMTLA